MSTWEGPLPPPGRPIGPLGALLIALRGAALVGVLYGGLLLLLVLRLIERPLFGAARPWTPKLSRAACRVALPILGLRYKVRGTPLRAIGAVVANHGSWLDIFALNACQEVFFVAKAEVASWAGIGWLARATGTLFIRRDPKEAKAQQAMLEARIRAGHHLLFFPEGTSTDGLRVLPFKSTLFAAFYSHGLDKVMQIQPVTVIYRAPAGENPQFYGWWGSMGFARHLVKVLACPRRGSVEVVFHPPRNVADYPSRKDLCAACEADVRGALPFNG